MTTLQNINNLLIIKATNDFIIKENNHKNISKGDSLILDISIKPNKGDIALIKISDDEIIIAYLKSSKNEFIATYLCNGNAIAINISCENIIAVVTSKYSTRNFD